MLSYASTRSVEMQASEGSAAGAMPFCGDVDMATAARIAALGAELGLASGDRQDKPGSPHKHVPCLYCAAAAYAPILSPALGAQQPVPLGFVAFSLLARATPLGQVDLHPRARGPPSNPLTA